LARDGRASLWQVGHGGVGCGRYYEKHMQRQGQPGIRPGVALTVGEIPVVALSARHFAESLTDNVRLLYWVRPLRARPRRRCRACQHRRA